MFKVYELPMDLTETDFHPRWVIDCGHDLYDIDFQVYLFTFQGNPEVSTIWKSRPIDWYAERDYAIVGWSISEQEAKKVLRSRVEELRQQELVQKVFDSHIRGEGDKIEVPEENPCPEGQKLGTEMT